MQLNGVRRWLYAKTEKEAKKKLAALQKQVAVNNCIPTPGRRTVQDLIDEWLSTAGPSLKPRTLAGYQWYMKQYVSPVLGNISLSKLTPTHIQRLYASFLDKGQTRTATIVHARLHSCFKAGVLWNWLPDNPTERTMPPKHQYKRKDMWTQDEMSLFLESIEGHWLQPLMVTLISSGVRLAEALGLKWSDVDFDRRTLQVSQNVGGQIIPPFEG